MMANRKVFFGDSKLCYTDSCEFFLLCWLTGGLIQKSCGGFLFACCHRPGISPELPTPYADSLDHPDLSYGPVRSDPQCGTTQQGQSAQRRIVGGDEAGFGSFPWQVNISESRFLCLFTLCMTQISWSIFYASPIGLHPNWLQPLRWFLAQ